jgi:OOP family OmpA-OmpF porin
MMKRKFLHPLLFVMMSALLFSCASTMNFAPESISPDQYTRKVDDFVIILDASESMDKYTRNGQKFKIAKALLASMNQTIPELGYSGSLQVFGGVTGAYKTQMVYFQKQYTTDGFQKGLDKVTTSSSNTYLKESIDAVADRFVYLPAPADAGRLNHHAVDPTDDVFKAFTGKFAVVVVSDGARMSGGPVAAAKSLKEMYGDDVTIYSVVVGGDLGGAAVMGGIAEAGGGFSVNAAELGSASAMGDFVKKVFIAADGDNDGVSDDLDKCPDTPAGVYVNPDGCSPDSDEDGVYDYLDFCSKTPKGISVDAQGCPSDTDGDGKYDDHDRCPYTPEWLNDVNWGCPTNIIYLLFDYDKYDLKPEMMPFLDEYVDLMTGNPALKMSIQGHTDSHGTDAYNQTLSENRANSVKDYLVSKGVAPDRLTTVGFGESRPIASNGTDAGRAKNRRDEIIPAP